MDIQNKAFLSLEQATDRYLKDGQSHSKVHQTAGQMSFRQVLEQKTLERTDTELKFSKHATLRLQDRGIELSQSQMERLNGGVKRAQEKGIKDSLVIVDELAFIVNVPNNTVVTAMNSNDANENVFTNINGAVIG